MKYIRVFHEDGYGVLAFDPNLEHKKTFQWIQAWLEDCFDQVLVISDAGFLRRGLKGWVAYGTSGSLGIGHTKAAGQEISADLEGEHGFIQFNSHGILVNKAFADHILTSIQNQKEGMTYPYVVGYVKQVGSTKILPQATDVSIEIKHNPKNEADAHAIAKAELGCTFSYS